MSDAYDRVLTEEEALDYCGRVSRSTWKRLERAGQGPAVVRIGRGPKGRKGYRLSDLNAFIAARRTEAARVA